MWPQTKRFSNKTNTKSKFKRSIEPYKERTIETLIVADNSLYNHFESLNENLEEYLLSVFNMVSLLFKDPSLGNPIKFSLVRIIIIQNETVIIGFKSNLQYLLL